MTGKWKIKQQACTCWNAQLGSATPRQLRHWIERSRSVVGGKKADIYLIFPRQNLLAAGFHLSICWGVEGDGVAAELWECVTCVFLVIPGSVLYLRNLSNWNTGWIIYRACCAYRFFLNCSQAPCRNNHCVSIKGIVKINWRFFFLPCCTMVCLYLLGILLCRLLLLLLRVENCWPGLRWVVRGSENSLPDASNQIMANEVLVMPFTDKE